MPSLRLSFRFAIAFIASFAFSQPQAAPPKLQTARQALIEMVTKGGDAVQKHLTVEVQELLKSAGKSNPAMAAFGSLGGDKSLQGFETGEILFAYGDSAQTRYEVRIENDDLVGDEDSLLLSLHTFRDGKEEEQRLGFFMGSHFTVMMKRQQNVW